jgi:uncharacterized delta-60 repeat protein
MKSHVPGLWLALMMAAATTAEAGPGDFDPGFASGSGVHSWGSLRLYPRADRRLLLADRSSAEGGDGRPILIALGREGQKDLSFGQAGTLALSVPAGSRWTEVLSIAPDGKVMATATTNDGNLILRLNSDGTPDPGFGVGGLLVLNERPEFSHEGVGTRVERIAVRGDGRLLVLELPWDCTNWWDGICFYAGGPGFLRQINADGSLDAGYGAGGIVEIPGFSPEQQIESLPLRADGSLVLSDRKGELRIVAADGSEVRSVSTGTRADTITALQDGRLLLAAKAPDGWALELARLLPDGSPDLSFGGGGGKSAIRTHRRILGLRNIAASSDGRYLYVAVHPEASQLPYAEAGTAILRLLTSGEPDPEFGDQGFSLFSHIPLRHFGIELDRDDRPLVQGSGQILRLTVDDTPGPGILSIRSGSFIPGLREEAVTFRLEVSRLAGSTGATGVRVAIHPISEAASWTKPELIAVEGKDFVLATSRLDWADGDDSDKSILIQILEDSDVEEGELFRVELVASEGNVPILGQFSTLAIGANGIATPVAGPNRASSAVPTAKGQSDGGGGSLQPMAIGLLWLLLMSRRRPMRSGGRMHL